MSASQLRVVAAMSSGEGAEETAKDAGDIEAFFKTGKTNGTSALGRFETHGELLPCGPAAGADIVRFRRSLICLRGETQTVKE